VATRSRRGCAGAVGWGLRETAQWAEPGSVMDSYDLSSETPYKYENTKILGTEPRSSFALKLILWFPFKAFFILYFVHKIK